MIFTIMRHKCVVFLLALFVATALHAATVLPKPDKLVTDKAGILSGDDIEMLTEKLERLHERGLAQTLIYITPSLPKGETMEAVTLASANAWGVGDKKRNDGIVIFVFMNDRKIRIELGLGVARRITNATAAKIIEEKIVPAFKKKAFAQGLSETVKEIEKLLAK